MAQKVRRTGRGDTQQADREDSLTAAAQMVMRVPTVWVAAMMIVALVSSVDVQRTSGRGTIIRFALGTEAIVAIALIWLPAMLRLFVLTGGSVKALGVEASAAGLVGSPSELIASLSDIRTNLELLPTMKDEHAREVISDLESKVDEIASTYIPESETLTDEVLHKLARDYETLRTTQPSGRVRTTGMSRVLNEVRVRAQADPTTARRKARDLIRSGSEGDRIVGLALAQVAPNRELLDDVLRLVTNSSSAYEQYHALLALEDMAASLSPSERAEAIGILEHEKSDPRGVGVRTDPGKLGTIDRTIRALAEGRSEWVAHKARSDR